VITFNQSLILNFMSGLYNFEGIGFFKHNLNLLTVMLIEYLSYIF
jgi:hypothetical protein